MQQMLLAILDAGEELAAGFGDVLWIRLPLKHDLHIHLRAQFLVRHMNRNLVAANLAEKPKQLPPEPIELARVGISGQPPAPEILDAKHRRQTGAIPLRGHQDPAAMRSVIGLMDGPYHRAGFGRVNPPVLSESGQLRPNFTPRLVAG